MNQVFYDKNIEAMRDRFPDVIKYLELPDEELTLLDEEKDIVVGTTDVSGKKIMCVQKGNKMIRLDSLYNSEDVLDLWYRTLDTGWDLDAKLMMYGLGNGMFVRKFLETTRKDCSIVVHEPSVKMLRAALENFDLSDIFTDVRVRFVFWPLHMRSDDIGNYYHKEVFSYKDLDSQKYAYYPNYPRIFEEDSSQYISGISDARDAVYADRVVFDRFGEDYNRNTFNNLLFIPESLSYEDLINEMPEDIPAIIVAAGPSLDKNINELKKAMGRCLIISTDTALKPLALAGIDPDLSAIMDGKKDDRYMSEEASRRVPMFCTPRSGGSFLNLHKGPKFFTDYYCDHVKEFMDREGCTFMNLPTGGSVANSCFGIAESLHCKRIILVGQDLAYTGDKTHSAVTVRGEKYTAVEDLEHAVMGVDINGDPIRTSLEFKAYKDWFEHEIKVHPELKVIDSTEGGIRIEGTILMSLRDAIEQECTEEFDFKEIIDKVGRLLPGSKKQKYLDYIGMIPEQLSDLQRIINASLIDYRNMKELIRSDKYHSPQFRSVYKKTQDSAKKIEDSPVIEYVQNQLQERSSELLEEVNKLEKDEKSELLTACNLGEKHLKDMLDAISELEPYVNKMKCDLKEYRWI